MHNINNTNNAQFDDKNLPASPRIFAFGFFAENRYICTVMQGDTAAAQANGQAGARPCKMTVGDAGTEAEKPSQFVDIHRAYIRTEAPLSALFSPRKRTFFGLFAANKSILTCLSTPYIKRSQSLPKQGSSEKGTLSIYQSVYMADLNVYR